MKKRFKVLCIILAIIFAVLIVVDLLYLIRGSLEMIPTEEQIEKARVTSIAILIPLVVLEALVLVPIFRKK
ncbi:MAG: hypothetical protein IKB35_00085 [Clostridia bacterium]|nr:hypothetical protein [Clostridia bacterium]